MGKTVLEVNVTGVEKRRHPNKHYVYIIEVTWSEGTTTVIYRRYSRFFDFQCALLEKFPVEGGIKDPSQRIIPFLPGKKLLGRSHVRSVAQKRLVGINEYCKTLIRLPPKISDDASVLEFFEVADEDINPIKVKKKDKSQDSANIISDPILLEQYVAIGDYNKDKSNECSLRAGQTVEVIEKNENGWWFVNVDNCHEGWVPATFLEPLGDTDHSKPEKLAPGKEEVYISTNSYTAMNTDEVSFEKGVLLEVIMKGLDGWWNVRYKGQEGMAPSAYLEKYNQSLQASSATPTELVSTPSEAAATSKPAVKTKSPSTGTKSRTVLDVTESDNKRAKELKSRPVTVKTAPPPRKESIKRKPIKVKMRSRDSVSSESAEVYVTIADFTDQAGDGLSFKAGAQVEVITKNSSGWWYVQLDNEEGWVPSSYLDKAKQPIKKQNSMTRSTSHDLFNAEKLTSSKSQDNLDQIGSTNRFPSLEVNKKRTFTSGNKLELKETQSISLSHSRSPDPVRKTTHGTSSRRSPPPLPAALQKQQTKKISETPSRHEAKKVVVPDRSHDPSHDRPHTSDLAKVLKKKFESDSTTTVVPPVIARRDKTVSQPDPPVDKTISPNKEKKAPPPRPKQGPQKKVGPSRPAISPALKAKMGGAAASDAKKQDHWITCNNYSEATDGCLSFSKGQSVEVIDDSNSDWWYVRINGREGYAPVTYLTKKDTPVTYLTKKDTPVTYLTKKDTPVTAAVGPKPPVVKKRSTTATSTQPPKPVPRGGGKKRMYKALADYGDEDGGLSFHEGDVLELLDDSDDWWFVKLGTIEGWAPSTYLEPVN